MSRPVPEDLPPARGSGTADHPASLTARWRETAKTVLMPRRAAAHTPGAPKPPAQPQPHSPSDAAPPPRGDLRNALPVGTHLGEFELQRVVGAGGFGIVYAAHDHMLDRRVAIKEYMPTSLTLRRSDGTVGVADERLRRAFEAGRHSFLNEARLLAQFDHPSLIKVYRVWQANGTAYTAMPFCEGTTLKAWLQAQRQAPSEAWLLQMLGPLTEALQTLHSQRCLHRDIAPDNILLLADSGRPMLLDFGAARQVIGDMTQALTVVLKPGYAPLEKYAEVPGLDQGTWTDVYALAAVVHRAITGHTPPVAVARMVRDDYQPLALRRPAGYSPRLLAAVDHGLQLQPAQRTPSIQALRAELGLDLPAPRRAPMVAPVPPSPGVAAAEPPASRPAALAARAHRLGLLRTPLRRAQWGAAALAGLGLALGLLAWSLSTGRSARAPAPMASASSSPRAAPGQPAAQAQPSPGPPAGIARPAPVADAAPPTTAPPPAATPRFAVPAEFDRLLQAQTPGHLVQVSTPKRQLRIGHDQLQFTVSSAQAGHVQVLAFGPDGTLVQLLPNAQVNALRIRPGQPLRLPPATSPFDASEPLGREEVIVIVSRQPRTLAHLGGSLQDGLWQLPAGAQREGLAATAEGATPLLLGRATHCPDARCDDYGAARFVVDVQR